MSKQKDITHELARQQIELYLRAKEKKIADCNKFQFPPEFIKKHKLGTPSRPNTTHSYDILTDDHILIEVDDLGKHSKKSQKINDGIATDYAETNLVPLGYKFYRLLKEEIVDKRGHIQEDVYHYLRTNLF